MNALTKVLVVDNGERDEADLLSTGLAELGLSSVTTSVEAAQDVLEVIERPSAIFINMPDRAERGDYASFARLASVLRTGERTTGIPVIEWHREQAIATGGISAVLRTEVGPLALSEAEF